MSFVGRSVDSVIALQYTEQGDGGADQAGRWKVNGSLAGTPFAVSGEVNSLTFLHTYTMRIHNAQECYGIKDPYVHGRPPGAFHTIYDSFHPDQTTVTEEHHWEFTIQTIDGIITEMFDTVQTSTAADFYQQLVDNVWTLTMFTGRDFDNGNIYGGASYHLSNVSLFGVSIKFVEYDFSYFKDGGYGMVGMHVVSHGSGFGVDFANVYTPSVPPFVSHLRVPYIYGVTMTQCFRAQQTYDVKYHIVDERGNTITIPVTIGIGSDSLSTPIKDVPGLVTYNLMSPVDSTFQLPSETFVYSLSLQNDNANAPLVAPFDPDFPTTDNAQFDIGIPCAGGTTVLCDMDPSYYGYWYPANDPRSRLNDFPPYPKWISPQHKFHPASLAKNVRIANIAFPTVKPLTLSDFIVNSATPGASASGNVLRADLNAEFATTVIGYPRITPYRYLVLSLSAEQAGIIKVGLDCVAPADDSTGSPNATWSNIAVVEDENVIVIDLLNPDGNDETPEGTQPNRAFLQQYKRRQGVGNLNLLLLTFESNTITVESLQCKVLSSATFTVVGGAGWIPIPDDSYGPTTQLDNNAPFYGTVDYCDAFQAGPHTTGSPISLDFSPSIGGLFNSLTVDSQLSILNIVDPPCPWNPDHNELPMSIYDPPGGFSYWNGKNLDPFELDTSRQGDIDLFSSTSPKDIFFSAYHRRFVAYAGMSQGTMFDTSAVEVDVNHIVGGVSQAYIVPPSNVEVDLKFDHGGSYSYNTDNNAWGRKAIPEKPSVIATDLGHITEPAIGQTPGDFTWFSNRILVPWTGPPASNSGVWTIQDPSTVIYYTFWNLAHEIEMQLYDYRGRNEQYTVYSGTGGIGCIQGDWNPAGFLSIVFDENGVSKQISSYNRGIKSWTPPIMIGNGINPAYAIEVSIATTEWVAIWDGTFWQLYRKKLDDVDWVYIAPIVASTLKASASLIVAQDNMRPLQFTFNIGAGPNRLRSYNKGQTWVAA